MTNKLTEAQAKLAGELRSGAKVLVDEAYKASVLMRYQIDRKTYAGDRVRRATFDALRNAAVVREVERFRRSAEGRECVVYAHVDADLKGALVAQLTNAIDNLNYRIGNLQEAAGKLQAELSELEPLVVEEEPLFVDCGRMCDCPPSTCLERGESNDKQD